MKWRQIYLLVPNNERSKEIQGLRNN